MNEAEIGKEVQERLKSLDQRIDFRVIESAIRREEDWWYVPVVTLMVNGQPAARSFAVSLLAKVEADMFAEKSENILFIPSSAA